MELLGRLRHVETRGGRAERGAAAEAAIRAVIGATVNGIAAGLQNTGSAGAPRPERTRAPDTRDPHTHVCTGAHPEPATDARSRTPGIRPGP